MAKAHDYEINESYVVAYKGEARMLCKIDFLKTSYFLQADEKNSRGKKELANKIMLTISGCAL